MSGNDSESRVVEVLLVEDNPVDARIFHEILEHAGTFNVSSASSLAEALTVLRSKSFGAVVIDLNLPDSRGLDTLVAILRGRS